MTEEEKARLALQAHIDQLQAALADMMPQIEAFIAAVAEVVEQVAAAITPYLRAIWRWWNGYDAYRVPVPVGWYRMRVSARHPAVIWLPPLL